MISRKYKLDKSKVCRNLIISAILTTSLLNAHILKQETMHNNDIGHEMYSTYSKAYLDTISELDKTKFDKTFIDIYHNGKYYIDEIEYDVSELYIVTTNNGENHVIKAGENKRDILTGQIFEEKRINIECLRNTSIFYKLYQDGIITSKEIKLDKNILAQYVRAWDGQNQYEVPELIADKKARERIKRR